LLQPHAATKQRAQPFSTKPLLYPTQSPHREDIRGVTCGAAAPMMEQPETYDEAGQPRGYRRNVGVCLLHPSGKVFVARRLDDSSQAWQMPQGGIDEGEDPAAAAARELREETGVRSARIVAAHPDWLQYDFPPEVLAICRRDGRRSHRGQRQAWYLMLFEGDESEINLDQPEPEFGEWRWVDLQHTPLHVVPFKRDVYTAVVAHFQPLIVAHLSAGRWVE